MVDPEKNVLLGLSPHFTSLDMGCTSSKTSGEQKPTATKPATKPTQRKETPKKGTASTKPKAKPKDASSEVEESSEPPVKKKAKPKAKAVDGKATNVEKPVEEKPVEEKPAKEKPAKDAKKTKDRTEDKPVADTQAQTREVKKDEMKVGKATESVTEDGKHQIVFDLANDDHKYVVGKGGENIKSIRSSTGADVQLDPEKKKADTVIITADSIENARKAQKLVLESVQKVKDQHNDTEAWYQEYQKKVDEHARKRQEYFDASKKAHDEGDGKLAKELSEKGKQEGELMKKAQAEAARAVFKKRNADNGDDVIDLHGLQVEPAVEIVAEYLDKWTKKSGSYTIITGKGLHSDEKGPKIRPAVEKLLKDRNIKFEDVPGQFDVST